MSVSWLADMRKMHEKFGVHESVDDMDKEKLKAFYKFRIKCIEEELDELKDAKTPEAAADAIIDIAVFTIGMLDCFNVNGTAAWDEVLRANMAKERGNNKNRPNKYGLPDLIKPKDWKGPDYSSISTGFLKEIFTVDTIKKPV